MKLVLPMTLEFHRLPGLRREREPCPDGAETGGKQPSGKAHSWEECLTRVLPKERSVNQWGGRGASIGIFQTMSRG